MRLKLAPFTPSVARAQRITQWLDVTEAFVAFVDMCSARYYSAAIWGWTGRTLISASFGRGAAEGGGPAWPGWPSAQSSGTKCATC